MSNEDTKPRHPLAVPGEIALSILFVLALLKLPSVSSVAKLASDLPQVSDYGQFIEFSFPGLDKYGAYIALGLTGLIAVATGASPNPHGPSRVGMTVFALTIPAAAVALAGVSNVVIDAVVFGVLGLVLTRSRNDYVPSRLINLIVWAIGVAGVYVVAVLFAQA